LRVVVIDNIDSFVYNLVQYLGELGADPVVFNNRSRLEEVERVGPEAVVISPGPKTPSEAGISLEVVRKFYREVPILGVCLGHQTIAQAFGGRIGRAKRILHGKTSRIRHDGSELFKGVPNPFEATRYHSLVVESLPPELRPAAWTDDGLRELMGLRHVRFPVFGLQFHPESILTEYGKTMVRNFLEVVG
jgi:anthranilate synthase/aminodeoxychorismate synthase-like glutamine amidotransferase